MRFYEINSDEYEDGQHYVATRAEAVREAKGLKDTVASVYLVAIPDTRRESILALANNRGWCSHRELVWHGKDYDPNWVSTNTRGADGNS